jgi:large subunit ribosomal protein L11
METVELIVEGGKAAPNAATSQKLGPMGINIGEVMNKVNEKTADFKGMKVPVKIKVDGKTKEFDVEVGTPPVSELIKKELGLQKGSGTPDKIKVGNMAIEQAVKVAKMKRDGMFVNDIKAAVKAVVGSANSLGILVEGLNGREMNTAISEGKYDEAIDSGKTEIDDERKKSLKEQLDKAQEQLNVQQAKLKKETPKEEEKKEVAEGEEKAEEKKDVKKDDKAKGKEAKSKDAKKK